MGISINSGGASGTDEIFEQFATEHNFPCTIYSFIGHQTQSKNRKILTNGELKKSMRYIVKIAKILHRYINNLNWYRKNLIYLNFYIIKNCHIVIAFEKIIDGKILGGTAWGCELALQYNIPVFIFDLSTLIWNRYRGINKIFECSPKEFLSNTSIIAGIGASELTIEQKIIVKKEIGLLLLPFI